MKNIKIILFSSVLIIVFLTSAVFLFGLTKNQFAATEYYHFHEQYPLKITIKSDDSFTEICKKDDVFKVNEFENIPINEVFCSEIFDAMKQLKTKNIFKPQKKLEEFGLSEPQVIVTADFDGFSKTLRVGDLNPDANAYYCLEEEKGEIGLIPAIKAEPFFRKHSQYASLNLVPYSAKFLDENGNLSNNKIKKLVIKRFDLKDPLELALDQNDGKLKVCSPKDFELAEEARIQLENAPVTLNANNIYIPHPSDETMKLCGLSNPLMEVTYVIDDRTYSFKVGYMSNRPEISNLNDLNFDAYKNIIYKSYYLMMDNIPAIYTISESSLPWLNMRFTK